MSTPAPVRFQAQSETRSATQGVAYIPNSIVENQALLTPAELALVLIVCRRGENTVSDRHWEAWTGKDPKMKNHAIRGLRDKGLRQIGRGNGAKFAFDRNAWDSWVRSRPRHERARTLGRSKSVSAKAGQMIHPECRERGCQKLCDTQPGVISISQAPATPNWKPVSDSPPPESPPSCESSQESHQQSKTPGAASSKPQEPSAAQLQQLIGIFLSLGVGLSQLDLAKCEKLWNALKAPERATALAYAHMRQADDWIDRASRFVPRPWNYLAEKHWERRAIIEGRKQSATESEKKRGRVADILKEGLFKP